MNTTTEPPTEPFATWSTRARWVLRFAFAIRCYGLGERYLWNDFEAESSIFSTLLFEWNYPETFAQHVDDVGMQLVVAAGVIVLLTGFFNHCFARWLSGIALGFAIVWELLLPLTKMIRGGELLANWALAEHALRLAIPIVLLILHFSDRLQPTEWVLRIAVAVTFGIHGIKAWLAAGTFETMIIATCENLFGFWLESSPAKLILKVICVADLLVALLVVARRWPRVAAYATVWGLLTALARYTSDSLGWPESLLRAAHIGGPYVLYLQWRRTSAEEDEQDLDWLD